MELSEYKAQMWCWDKCELVFSQRSAAMVASHQIPCPFYNVLDAALSVTQSPPRVRDQQRDLHEDGVPAGRVPERSEVNG